MFSIRALLLLLSIALVARLTGWVIRAALSVVFFTTRGIAGLLVGAVRCFV